MPRLKVEEFDKQKKVLIAKIKYAMTLYDISPKELSLALHISIATFYNRLNNPGRFTLEELYRLSKKLHFSFADLMDIKQ